MELCINELISKADAFNQLTRLEVEARDADDEMKMRANATLNGMGEICNEAAERGKYFADIMELNHTEVPSSSHPVTKVPAPEALKGAAAIVALDVIDFFPHVEVFGTHDNRDSFYYIRVHWKVEPKRK